MEITVLVPTYRRLGDLQRCLEALARQTEPADEVLLVVREDDEETLVSLRQRSSKNMRLAWVTVTEPGQVVALNRGLEEVRTEIIAILDDDAAPHPEWLARIRRHFEADATIGGVGGRDHVFRNGNRWAGRRRVVGKVQWFGRVIGNHHHGFGGPRDVDTLKGANMSFRREAIEGLQFDRRLRGNGAQVHNDLTFCLKVKRRGWRLIYDPGVSVDHFLAERHDVDRRSAFNAEAVSNASHNATVVLLEHLPPVRRTAFVAWTVLVGTRAVPGLLQFVRLTLRGDRTAMARTVASQRGRWEGWKTWWRSRPSSFA